jgi:hypothetical protein
MAKKKEVKASKANSTTEQDEKKLYEEHPYETMSQIQNRYGKGRRKPGSDTTPSQDARGMDR